MPSEIAEVSYRKVHNGAAASYTKVEVPCNGFCKPPVHCDLVYNQINDPTALEFTLFMRLYLGEKATLVKFEKAMEAGPVPDHYIEVIRYNPDFEIYAWLIFWKISE